jgi:hypothetical protein
VRQKAGDPGFLMLPGAAAAAAQGPGLMGNGNAAPSGHLRSTFVPAKHTGRLRPFQRSICNPYVQYCRKFFIVRVVQSYCTVVL